MRVFKTILVLIIASINLLNAAPASFLRLEHRGVDDEAPILPLDNFEPFEAISTSPTTVAEEDNYDQRQNGTENYRIHVDGLVVVVAPVEALLLAGGAANGIGDDFISGLSPPGTQKPDIKPDGVKPTSKPTTEEKPEVNIKPGEIHKKSAHR